MKKIFFLILLPSVLFSQSYLKSEEECESKDLHIFSVNEHTCSTNYTLQIKFCVDNLTFLKTYTKKSWKTFDDYTEQFDYDYKDSTGFYTLKINGTKGRLIKSDRRYIDFKL